ncbi:pyridoxal phosphate-dependent aminotransferase [Roseovarius sp. 2305UL8-3]|uniref:pyridoxal phosphate-dependent aminotransferase n=1 Tax=Roseovarius conchicola TaxID=3121636 RepID=UPI003529A000
MAGYALADLQLPDGINPAPLAQNESCFPPSPKAIDAAAQAMTCAQFYPDPGQTDLRQSIASVHGLNIDNIVCGAGSMELISALTRCYAGPGLRVLTTQYGYAFFRTASIMAEAEIDFAPEVDFTVSVDTLLAAVQPTTNIIFVANPGNPTGTVIPRGELLRLRDGLDENVLLVIDEAYGEFNDSNEAPMFDLVERGNTVVLRTFSKAYSLAGMRMGWGLFPTEIVEQVTKILCLGSASVASLAAAAAAMLDQDYMKSCCADVAKRRDSFAKDLSKLGLTVPQSKTNFVLVGFRDEAEAVRTETHLRQRGVLTRGMGGYGLSHCIRITIGSAEEMDLTGQLIGEALGRFSELAI